MKIKKWEELNGMTINGTKITYYNMSESMKAISENINLEFFRINQIKKSALAHLSLLGIKVEFEEVQTLTKKECYFLKYITEGLAEDLTITRNKSGINLFVEYDFNDRSSRAFEASATTNLFPWFEIGKSYLASDLKKLPSWVN
jgi:hypothetical protein